MYVSRRHVHTSYRRNKILGRGFSLNDKFVLCDHELTSVYIQQIKKCIHAKNISQAPLVKYFDFFPTPFFPKFELPNSGCGLSASAAYLPVFLKVCKYIPCTCKFLHVEALSRSSGGWK